jgi:hypothetical protein
MTRLPTLLVALGALTLAACSSSTSVDPKPVTPQDDTGATDTIPDTKVALVYPDGPYGKNTGDILPNLSWDGYRNGTEWTTISMLDYYDPDGSKGVTAIKVNLTAQW